MIIIAKSAGLNYTETMADTIVLPQGDTAPVRLKFLDVNGGGIDIANHSVTMTIRRFTDQTENQLRKTNSAGGHGDQASQGVSEFTLTNAESLGLALGLWYASGTAKTPNSTQVLTSLIEKIEIRPSQQD